MEYTTNYNLKKPGDQDNVLVDALNENMDTVDATMKALSDGKANLDPETGKVPDNELPDDLFLKLIGGTMKGNIQMANFLVKGLPDPQEDGDAARKAYVDALRTYLDTGGFAKIQAGSYMGTNAYGENSPNSLIFAFPPKLVICACSSSWYSKMMRNSPGAGESASPTVINMGMVPTSFSDDSLITFVISGSACFAKKSSDGKTLSWYNKTNSYNQINSSGYTYYWIAIG